MSTSRVRHAVRTGTANAGLVVLCGTIGVIELLLLVATGVVTDRQQLPVVLAGIGLYRLLLVGTLATVLPGCYAVYREDVGLRGTPRRAAAALREAGPRLFAASVLTRVLALLGTLLLFVITGSFVLGVDTLAVWSEALVGVGVDRTLVSQWGLFAAVLAAAWLVNGLVAYQDLLVIDGRASVIDAWRESARAVLARPGWYVWQALLRGILLAAPWALAFLAVLGFEAFGVADSGAPVLPLLLALAVLVVLLTAVSRAVLVAYHVETMDAVVGPATAREVAPLRESAGRVALAALVVLAAVGGVAAVRAGDVTPGPDVPDATVTPDDPAATIETAIERTADRSRATTERYEVYNESIGEWQNGSRYESRIDHRTGRLSHDVQFYTDSPWNQTFYATDGVAAARGDNVRFRATRDLHVGTVREPWELVIGYSFGELADDLRYLEAGAGQGARLVSANDSTLVYVVSDPSDFHDVDLRSHTPDPADEDITYEPESELRFVIDRETATVDRVVQRLHFRDQYDDDEADVRNFRTTITYRDVGRVSVERPDSLGGPGPLETVWDVVYYA